MKSELMLGALAVGGVYVFMKNKKQNPEQVISGGGESKKIISQAEKTTIPGNTQKIKTPISQKQVTLLKKMSFGKNDNVKTKVITTSVGHNGHTATHTTIITDKKNIPIAESKKSFQANLGTDTTIIYENRHKKVIGGSDFKIGQSLTSSQAQFMKKQAKNPIFTALRSSGGWF